MQLLNQLQTGATAGQAKLTQRLWAFFRHPMVSVRLAAVRLFAKLVAFPAPKCKPTCSHAVQLPCTPHRIFFCRSCVWTLERRRFVTLLWLVAVPAVKQEECNSWQPDVLPPSLRLVFESLLQEGNADVLTATQVTDRSLHSHSC